MTLKRAYSKIQRQRASTRGPCTRLSPVGAQTSMFSLLYSAQSDTLLCTLLRDFMPLKAGWAQSGRSAISTCFSPAVTTGTTVQQCSTGRQRQQSRGQPTAGVWSSVACRVGQHARIPRVMPRVLQEVMPQGNQGYCNTAATSQLVSAVTHRPQTAWASVPAHGPPHSPS